MAELSGNNVEQTDKIEEELCCIEASVVTGFEECARGEAKEKFDAAVQAARGKIVWKVPLSRVKEVVKMGSIDNCRVVMHSVPHFKFSNDQHDCLARLQKMLLDLDWEMGLRVWGSFFDFPHPIASKPEVIPSPDELVDVVIIERTQYKDPNARRNNKKGGRGKKKERKKDKDNRSNKRDASATLESGNACDDNQNATTEDIIKLETCTREDADSSDKIVTESSQNQTREEHGNENGAGQYGKPIISLDANQEVQKLQESEKIPSGMEGRTRVIIKRPEPKIEVKVLIPGPDEDAFPTQLDDTDHRNVEPMDVDVSMNVGNEPTVSPRKKLELHDTPTSKKERDTVCMLASESDVNDVKSSQQQVQSNDKEKQIESHVNGKLDQSSVNDEVFHIPSDQDKTQSLLIGANMKEFGENALATEAFASSVIEKLKSPSPVKDFSTVPSKDFCTTPPTTPIVISTDPLFNPISLAQSLSPVITQTDDQSEEQVIGSSVDPPSFSQSSTNVLKSLPVSETISPPQAKDILSNAITISSPMDNSVAATNAKSDTSAACMEETSEEHSSNSSDKKKVVKKERDPTKPTFRVTCNRVGEGHPFDSSSAAASFGSAIIKYFNWGVDLKNFDIEVMLNIDNEEVTVGIALTKSSLHNRNLVAFGPTTLRATICYNMLRLCRIKTGDIICDPMCGTSALPIEGSLNWVNSFHFGGDYHELAIERSLKNMASLHEKHKEEERGQMKIGLVQWNLNYFPLREKCVDVFISDLPFGYRMGCRTVNRTLYPTLLSEMARTARPGARACLLTEDKTSLIKAIQTFGRFWQRRLILSINMGGLSGFVFLLTRTTASFSAPKVSKHTAESHSGMNQGTNKEQPHDKLEGEVQNPSESEVQNQLEGEVQKNSDGEVQNQLEGEVQKHLETEVQNQLDCDVQKHLESEVQNQLEGKVQKNSDGEVQNQLEGEVQKHLETEVQNQLDCDVQKQLDSEVQNQLVGEIQNQLEGEIQKQLEDEIQKQLEGEIQKQLEDEIQKQLDDEVQKLLEGEVQLEGEIHNQLEGEVQKQLYDEIKKQLDAEVQKQLGEDVQTQSEAEVQKQLEGDIQNKLEDKVQNQ